MINRKEIKTLGLLSGGLDSSIAVKLMVKLGYCVTVMNFMSPFCTCTKKSDGCKSAAHQIAKECGVEIKTVFMGEEYLEMLRAPKHGYGKGMNPCVDCRIMMFRQAGLVMKEIGARFIFTGEVLSQRPMSQMKNRMRQIEKESGLKDLIVRPLSAALLEPTAPEKEGLIDRGEMLAISGRSRKKQFEVGRELGLDESKFCTGGGCLLADVHFAGKMRDLIGHADHISVKEARLLRIGRHFRITDDCKVIVGRNHQENEKLFRMASEGDMVVRVKDHVGPCVVVKGKVNNGECARAGQIAARYSDAPNDIEVKVEISRHPGIGAGAETEVESVVWVRAINDKELESMRV